MEYLPHRESHSPRSLESVEGSPSEERHTSISEKVKQELSWFHFQNYKIANVPQQAKKYMSFCEVVGVEPLSGS